MENNRSLPKQLASIFTAAPFARPRHLNVGNPIFGDDTSILTGRFGLLSLLGETGDAASLTRWLG